MLDVVHCAHIS